MTRQPNADEYGHKIGKEQVNKNMENMVITEEEEYQKKWKKYNTCKGKKSQEIRPNRNGKRNLDEGWRKIKNKDDFQEIVHQIENGNNRREHELGGRRLELDKGRGTKGATEEKEERIYNGLRKL